MTVGITELPPEGMQLGGVALAGDAERGTKTTEGLSLLFTTAGITVQGPQPQIERLLVWSGLDSANCREKVALPDGRNAAVMELTSGGQSIRFLLPTGHRDPGQAAYLDQALPAWLARYKGGTASATQPPPPPPPSATGANTHEPRTSADAGGSARRRPLPRPWRRRRHQRVDGRVRHRAATTTEPPAPPRSRVVGCTPTPDVAPTAGIATARRADGGAGSTVHHRDPSRVRARTGAPAPPHRPPGTGRTGPPGTARHPSTTGTGRVGVDRPPPPPPPPPATGTAAAAPGTAAWTGAPSPATTGRGGQPTDQALAGRTLPRPRSRGAGASPRPPARSRGHGGDGCRGPSWLPSDPPPEPPSDPPSNPVPLTSVTLPPPPPQGTGAPGTPGAVVVAAGRSTRPPERRSGTRCRRPGHPAQKGQGAAPGGEGHRRRCRRCRRCRSVPLVPRCGRSWPPRPDRRSHTSPADTSPPDTPAGGLAPR